MSHTVTSPFGDTLTVYNEHELAQALGYNGRKGGWQYLKPERLAVLCAFWEHGPVHSDAGFAGAVLAERASRYLDDGPMLPLTASNICRAGVFQVLCDLVNNGHARRTYDMRLNGVPDFWLPAIRRTVKAASAVAPTIDEPTNGDVQLDAAGGDVELPIAEPVPDVRRVEHVTDAGGTPASVTGASAGASSLAPVLAPVEVELTNAVATALLTQVVEIISTGNGAGAELSRLQLDVTQLEERLGVQVGYVDKLRRQLREAGDEIVALRHERDGLRQRLRSAEHNLRVATSADAQRIIDLEVQRQVDRFMRQTPDDVRSRVAEAS